MSLTYIVQRSTMLRRLNDLDRSLVPNLSCEIRRQRHLRKTPAAVVLLVAGTRNLKDGLHRLGVVEGDLAGAEVDVEEGGGVAGEPAWLDADGAAGDGPFRAVRGYGHSAACSI